MIFPPSTPPRSHFPIYQNLSNLSKSVFFCPNRIQKTNLNSNNNNKDSKQPEETKPKKKFKKHIIEKHSYTCLHAQKSLFAHLPMFTQHPCDGYSWLPI